MEKISKSDAENVCKKEMPKQMSDWIEERIGSYQCVTVNDGEKEGFAMKSRDGTIVFFNNWNCSSQFKNIVNKLR